MLANMRKMRGPSRPLSCLLAVGIALSLLSCQKGGASAESARSKFQTDDASGSALDGKERRNWPWVDQTFSPRPGSPPAPELEELVATCGQGDVALHEVAQLIADVEAETGETPSMDEVGFHLRRTGSPYVMPRLWSATMSGVDHEELLGHIGEWAKINPSVGDLRCGVGLHRAGNGSQTVTAIQVDAVADLRPVPTKVDTADWIELEAKFLRPTTAATVVLLPPEGPPRQVATDLRGQSAHARFSLSMPGTWLVQVMGTQHGGPRPVASALITAGEKPPGHHASKPVPGEGAFDSSLTPADALFELVNAARKEEGLPTLRRSRKLDRIALAHSEAMVEQGRISHDTGLGDPSYRVGASGLQYKATGENVAMAQTVPRLHRVLWASPSHRENLLLRRWDEVGVAIAERPDGSLFATQLFLDNQ